MNSEHKDNSNLQLVQMYKQSLYDTNSENNKRKSNLIWRALWFKNTQYHVNLDHLLSRSKLSFNNSLSRKNRLVLRQYVNPTEYRRFNSFNKRNDDFGYYFRDTDYYTCDELKILNDQSNTYKHEPFLCDSPGFFRTYDSGNVDFYSDYPRSNGQYFPNKDIYYPFGLNNDKFSRYPSFDCDKEPTKIRCIHCGTLNTSLWRKLNKQNICNACALYYKMHHVKRPTNLIKPEIRKRRRKQTKKEVAED